MNKQAILPLLLLLGIGVFFSFRMIADKKSHGQEYINDEITITPYEAPTDGSISKNQAIKETVMRVIRDGHYSPKPLDDNFSKKAFAKYIEMTDYTKLFLLQSDIDNFSAFETTIDNEIEEGTTKLYDLVSSTITKRIKEADTFYKEILKTPFSYNSDEEVELDGKKLAWCKSKEELKQRWSLNLRYRALTRYIELKEEQKKRLEAKPDAKDKKKTVKDTTKIKTNAELEAEARESVKKNMDMYFKRLGKIGETDRFATYMNSICHVIDPHTDFFPPKDKQRFDEEMSGSFFGIGAVLSSVNDECKIMSIVTGSPCWKDGRLKVGDVIQKVAQAADEPVDIAGWDTEDIVQIIRGKEGTEVRLTVKHTDGSVEVVSIRRGKVEIESTFAKSSIIKQDGLNIGYILLPEFYANFNERNGRRCAIDMAKEIEKLKKENVQGIIVDLRNNGGGSLTDVVEIGGMFIDKGPIVQVKSKGAPPQALTDREPGALYDGPLAILINQNSASASEILAAAMQDYKRGIVLGSTSFGKGTVQRVFPLEDFYNGDQSLLPFGSVKLTLQKFYRINGGSTQLKGVSPDIKLPDLYDMLDLGERRDSNSLAWDQVAKADYKPLKPPVDFNFLIASSQKRVANNESFKLIAENAPKIKKRSEDNKQFLLESKYVADMEENKAFSKKIEELEKNRKLNTIVNLNADKKAISIDSSSITKNEEWLKVLRKDPYITEASLVIADWIKAQKSSPVGKVNNKVLD